MLSLLITSRTRRKLIAFFMLNQTSKVYLRELAREIDESAHSVRLELANLEKGGLISSTISGRQKFFFLNRDNDFIDELTSIVKKVRQGSGEQFNFTDHERKEKLEKDLLKIKNDLVKKYRPDKIILFGSFINGVVTETTDLDILIIKDTQRPYSDRIREVVELCDYDVGVDFIIYNPEEFKEMQKTNSFVKNEIIKKGKVIYEKAA